MNSPNSCTIQKFHNLCCREYTLSCHPCSHHMQGIIHPPWFSLRWSNWVECKRANYNRNVRRGHAVLRKPLPECTIDLSSVYELSFVHPELLQRGNNIWLLYHWQRPCFSTYGLWRIDKLCIFTLCWKMERVCQVCYSTVFPAGCTNKFTYLARELWATCCCGLCIPNI